MDSWDTIVPQNGAGNQQVAVGYALSLALPTDAILALSVAHPPSAHWMTLPLTPSAPPPGRLGV